MGHLSAEGVIQLCIVYILPCTLGGVSVHVGARQPVDNTDCARGETAAVCCAALVSARLYAMYRFFSITLCLVPCV